MFNARAIGRTSRAAAIAAALALAAGGIAPASAAADPASEAKPAAKQEPRKAGKERQICVQDTVTGSRLLRKTCKTRAEWIRENGFDPLTEK